MSGLWACKAEFVPLAHNTTKITIRNPPISWSPGQHVFVSCHSIVPLQSHPFTICSIPEDKEMSFVVKAEGGGTKHFFHHAEKHNDLPENDPLKGKDIRVVAIQGPYGTIRPLRQFDSVVFLAGTTGATYTMPLLRDLVKSWQTPLDAPSSFFCAPRLAATRHIRFVWVVKSRGQLEWFSAQLNGVMEDALLVKSQNPARSIEISIYVTCDESFTEERKSLLTSALLPKSTAVATAACVESETNDEKQPLTQSAETDLGSNNSATAPTPPPAAACGPDGTCCCKTTIQDENDPSNTVCCCCAPAPSSQAQQQQPAPPAASPEAKLFSPRSITSTASSSRGGSKALHPSIAFFGGRPQCRNIIRRTLEQALGESAVVVCGPKGLVGDVKQSVVRLSDERAVHKGTGAQGIYLHTESFCF